MPRWERIPYRAKWMKESLERGDYFEVLAWSTNRFIPPHNPALWWDRLFIAGATELKLPRRLPKSRPVVASERQLELLYKQVPDSAEQFRRRVAQGQTCLVTERDGIITGRVWVVSGQDSYQTNCGLWFDVPSSPAIWCHGMHIEPKYRMGGLFVALFLGAREMYTVDGKPPAIYGEISFENAASVRAHESLGFTMASTITFVSVGGWKLYASVDGEGHWTFDRKYIKHIERI